jgi:prolyl-tRNA synthetase
VVPLWKNEEERAAVEPFARKAYELLQGKLGALKVIWDSDTDKRPADRFFGWVQQGIPFRLEIGPRDAAQGSVCLVLRHTRQKQILSLDELAAQIEGILETMQAELFQQALDRRTAGTTRVDTWADFQAAIQERKWVEAHWDGTGETEAAIKEATKATIRCLPFGWEDEPGTCVFSGKPSTRRVLFATAY